MPTHISHSFPAISLERTFSRLVFFFFVNIQLRELIDLHFLSIPSILNLFHIPTNVTWRI